MSQVLAISTTVAACGGALPRPVSTQVAPADYVAVPFAPRVPPVEIVPPSPTKSAVWVDGSWVWAGNRYGWRFGSWVVPPANVRRARWVVVRRKEDGQLFFAPSTWKDASGNLVEDRSFATALGPAARARSRIGAAPARAPGGMGAGFDDGAGRTADELEQAAPIPVEDVADEGDE